MNQKELIKEKDRNILEAENLMKKNFIEKILNRDETYFSNNDNHNTTHASPQTTAKIHSDVIRPIAEILLLIKQNLNFFFIIAYILNESNTA